MEGYKVVTAEEMVRIDRGNAEKAMEMAGQKVAEKVLEFLNSHPLPKQVTLLVGKGNNGGDAYAAGCALLEKGIEVSAYSLYKEVSSLNRKFREKYRRRGGRFSEELEGLLLDGLLGTGLKGEVDKKMASLIRQANGSGLPILAIDIPSGLHGTTGDIGGAAIFAMETIALGLPKIGFFLQEGWNHVGKLQIVDFGLSREAVAEAEAVAYLPKRLELPPLKRTRHKYEAGYVVGYAGSNLLSGAAKLAGFAALKAGAGIVRVFHPEEIGQAPLELICNPWNPKAWEASLKKANAVFIGPGLGPCKEWLKKHLKKIKQPCVIDADALLEGISYPKEAILTPHRGEMLRLLGLKTVQRDEELFAQVIRYAERKGVYVVLKGAPTVIFGPKHKPLIVPRGDPGMASAGTGDVLTGMIAALLAQGCSPYEAAFLGVTLHAIAGEKAAHALTSYCLTASALFSFMPAAFAEVLQGRDIV